MPRLRLRLLQIGVDLDPDRIEIGALLLNFGVVLVVEDLVRRGQPRVDLRDALAVGLVAGKQIGALGLQLQHLGFKLLQRDVLNHLDLFADAPGDLIGLPAEALSTRRWAAARSAAVLACVVLQLRDTRDQRLLLLVGIGNSALHLVGAQLVLGRVQARLQQAGLLLEEVLGLRVMRHAAVEFQVLVDQPRRENRATIAGHVR